MSCVEGEPCPIKDETCCDADDHLLVCGKRKGQLVWKWDGSSTCAPPPADIEYWYYGPSAGCINNAG